MGIIWEICLQTVEIFALVVAILGVLLSLLLLFAPQFIRSFSETLNRHVDVDTKIKSIADKEIRTEGLIYDHNIITGTCFIIGSAFILIFLYYRLDVKSLASLFAGYSKSATISEVIVGAMALVGKLTGIVGIIIGSVLLFSPEQLRFIEGRLNTWFSTQSMVDRLDRTYQDVDAVVFQKPIAFGIIGLIPSVVLLYLAIRNLLV